MATNDARTLDFLGEGTTSTPAAPGDGLTPEERQRLKDQQAQAQLREDARKVANINTAPGGFTDIRREDYQATLDANNRLAKTTAGQAGIELPFVHSLPGARAVEGAIEGTVGGGLEFLDTVADDPSLLGVGRGVVNAGDRLLTDVDQGLSADPLTSGVYNPAKRAVKAVGGAIGDAAGAVGDFFGGLGSAPAPVYPGGAAGGPANEYQDWARQLGLDVLGGSVGAPNAGDRALQMGQLGQVQQFMGGPREQSTVLGDVRSFRQQPRTPSAAELQLLGAQDSAMSDALSLARSARGGPGAVNRAMRVAQAENAATQATGARDLALLRAKEDEAFRAQQLQALGLEGQLGQGLDADTLRALGLGGDIATNIRGQGVTERGQTLGFAGDMAGASLNANTQLTEAAMRDALERTKLGYELTPDQKLLLAGLGAGSDILSLFF